MPNVKIRLETQQEDTNQLEALSREQKTKVATMTLLGTQLVANTKKILNYGVNNIGNFTGNYIAQEKIQLATDIVGDIATIGLGFATGLIGGAIAIAGVAVSKSLEAVTFFQDEKHKRNEIEYLRERSGNTLVNGSRGTEN